MFAPDEVPAGTVVAEAFSEALLIDLTTDPQREVSFDINDGWSWGGAPSARRVDAGTNIVPLLIEGLPTK